MHDTPAKGVFGDDFRFVSSGCIRLQNVRDYVAFLLRETPGWDTRRHRPRYRLGRAHRREDQPAVPVYWVYITAGARPDGVTQFREDIYQRDGLNARVVDAPDYSQTP